ncbi:MAG: 1-(5-phosphoribosyl)-5-[(5-phosphoribosylamino)methylideneamino] imidazole-4-carboxamide isomerase [Bacteroidota bacterium]
MIDIIPSIWIQNGKCVRIRQGDFSKTEEYKESPIDFARRFQDHGIKTVHLVDLDGARKGSPVNYHVLEAMAAHTSLNIDFAGGAQTDGDISKIFEYGGAYVTAASIAVTNPELFSEWVVTYGREKVTLAADSLKEKVVFRGWQKKSDMDLYDHIDFFYSRGLKYVKTTDISKDGSLEGPAFNLYEKILKKFPDIGLLASGGVRGIDDIKQLNEMGLFGVIFGKAYYEGKLKLEEIESLISSSKD